MEYKVEEKVIEKQTLNDVGNKPFKLGDTLSNAICMRVTFPHYVQNTKSGTVPVINLATMEIFTLSPSMEVRLFEMTQTPVFKPISN
jgi:hypothetical protein